MTDQSMRAEFEAWAKEEGYDVAYTYDTERSREVWLNPMTADLRKAWQAATRNALERAVEIAWKHAYDDATAEATADAIRALEG